MVGNFDKRSFLPLFLSSSSAPYLPLSLPLSFSLRPLSSLARSIRSFLPSARTACLGNHGGEFMVGNFGVPRIMVGNLGIPHHAMACMVGILC